MALERDDIGPGAPKCFYCLTRGASEPASARKVRFAGGVAQT
jgi:hypothetical protein